MRKSARASIDAMLRHLAAHHDPKDFPSTAYERQDLIEAAGKRRLIEWHKEGRRYELTPAGWRRLRRNGRLGMPALAIAGGIGAVAGAAALAMWLPSARPAADRAAVETTRAPSPAPAPPSATAVAVAPVAAPGAAPPDSAEPATGAEQPVATQPEGDPATAAAKDPASKKSRHGRARTPGHRNWNFGRYRDERYAGSGR